VNKEVNCDIVAFKRNEHAFAQWLAVINGEGEWLQCTITSQYEGIEEAECGAQGLKEVG
jgi:hypothetical protein